MGETTKQIGKRNSEATRRLLYSWRYRVFINARLRVASLRGFKRSWFISRSEPHAFPKASHIMILNKQLITLRRSLDKQVLQLGVLAEKGAAQPFQNLRKVRHNLDRRLVAVQKLWDFFFDMFSQRKSIYKCFLRRCDGVVSECYKLVFNRLGKSNPWIRTPPLCYLEKASSPATTRRGVRLSTRAPVRITNPFPVIKIPYDRIANPWTLTSLVHEVAHDVHGDISNFWQATKLKVYKTLRQAGIPKQDARVWSFWHKEILADLLGILFGGPAVVKSLMDLMSRPHDFVMKFRSHDSHPTPYLRVLLSAYTIGRLGYRKQAEQMQSEWKSRYPLSKGHRIPKSILKTAPKAIPIVAKTLLWTPYIQLGSRRLVDLVSYSKKMHRRVLAGSKQLLRGGRPVGLPKHLIISAGVYAFEQCPDKAKTIRRALFKSLDVRGAVPSTGRQGASNIIRKSKTAAGRVRALPSRARVVRLPRSRTG